PADSPRDLIESAMAATVAAGAGAALGSSSPTRHESRAHRDNWSTGRWPRNKSPSPLPAGSKLPGAGLYSLMWVGPATTLATD
ncbi:hypothetical protein HW555_006949, partial [Spodoptera exigua]